MLTCRDKMFKSEENVKADEETIKEMKEVFEEFIRDLENGEVENWEYDVENDIGWGIQYNTLTWEVEIHP